jgi:transposase
MKHSITWVGIDDSANQLDVALYYDTEKEPAAEFSVSTDSTGLGRLVKRLKARPGNVHCVYEAGVCGYNLQRFLDSKGIGCDVVAPSLTPRRSGRRVKTNKMDARKLATLYRAGELTSISIPTEKQEALRDLLRAREDVLEDVTRRRHRLSRFLLRHGLKYRLGKAWSKGHWLWIRSLRFEDPHLQTVHKEYCIGLQEALEQLSRFDQYVEEISQQAEYKRAADFLMAFRGIKAITALTIMAEAIDLRRYVSAPTFMSSVGIVPSEYSTGEDQRRGSITKAGNSHIRRVLIEAAWHYRHFPIAGKALKKRREGIPAEAVNIARKADQRLNKKYHRMVAKGKPTAVAAVAVARELAGFVWAMGQMA